eukprot:scaffold1691_cov107-Isochrysis_galbana.AAC.7
MEKNRKNHETAGIDEKSVATTMRIDSSRAISRSGRRARSTRSILMNPRNCIAGMSAARMVIHETSTTMKSSTFQPDLRYAEEAVCDDLDGHLKCEDNGKKYVRDEENSGDWVARRIALPIEAELQRGDQDQD